MTQPTIEQAAKAVGISEATAGRWMKERTFQDAYRAARRQALDKTLAFIEHTTLASVLVLRSVMLAADTPAPTKVAAAKVLLDTALRAFELGDQEARIQNLEQEMGVKR
jgi:hypothetical protein